MWENIRQQYKSKKLKIITPTWNDEFELPDICDSVSDIQDHIIFTVRNHKTLEIKYKVNLTFLINKQKWYVVL